MNPASITIRPFQLTDADDVLLWAGDDRIIRLFRCYTLTSKEEALTFITEVCMSHPWFKSICIDDRSIGFISVSPATGDDRCRADLGYAIAVQYWGQGITTRAVKMVLCQVFKEFPELVRLQAYTVLENKGSQRVLAKAGFVREGVLNLGKYK
ncbi:unnamed protein product [Fraxinus pennsylvanica]|uniref:N-acetyltransferase domain-containing protein n=1 Tax=Fraxinus pennsylvanica TaxID=56036 RepID=A0AAD1Z809_9LAMI|nr:unnamed protein product [Fraxinus pennsylvanica]